MEEIKHIPLEDLHIKLGAKMVPFAGYYMPVRYSSDIEEHMAVRNSVGIFDVSHMGEFRLKGDRIVDFLQLVTSNDVSQLTDGKAQYSCLPNGQGGIVDDIIVYRYKSNEYYLVVNASNIDKDWNWISKFNTFGVEMTNISDGLCLFAVQGPKATACLQKLTPIDLSTIPYYNFTVGQMAGFDQIIIANTGYTGSGGFELFVPKAHAASVWSKIMDAGSEFDIKPIGLGARDTLRLEKGFCLYGNDIDDLTSPIEAGLGWITKFNKKFTDSDLLLKQKEGGVSKKLVGFKMVDRGIPRSHYELVDAEGNKIGEVTSGTQSPILANGIGMGYVATAYSKIGTEIFVKIRDRNLKAVVSKMPFV